MTSLPHLLSACLCLVATSTLSVAQTDTWPKFRGPQADGSWNPPRLPNAEALADRSPTELWSQPIGSGYAGVTVSDGRVYVMDYHKNPEQIEQVLCYDLKSGELLWKHTWSVDYDGLAYGSGPRASVTIKDQVAYALGALGHLSALDAATGKVLWTQDTRETLGAKPPQWGFAASPFLLDNQLIIHVGAEPQGTVISLEKSTGKELWRTGQDPAGYSTPVLIEVDSKPALVQWTPEHVYALEPKGGKLLWKYPYSIRYGVSIAQPIYHKDILLVSSYWHGTRALQWKHIDQEPTLLWSVEDKLQGLMSQPLYREGIVYLLDRNLGLCAFDLQTGELHWTDEHLLTPKDRNPQISLVWLNQKEGVMGGLNAIGEWVVAKVSKEGIEEIARHQISGKTWAHPAFTDNGMIVRTDTLLSYWQLWE